MLMMPNAWSRLELVICTFNSYYDVESSTNNFFEVSRQIAYLRNFIKNRKRLARQNTQATKLSVI
jgi:hypothetical protein